MLNAFVSKQSPSFVCFAERFYLFLLLVSMGFTMVNRSVSLKVLSLKEESVLETVVKSLKTVLAYATKIHGKLHL